MFILEHLGTDRGNMVRPRAGCKAEHVVRLDLDG